MRKLTNDKAISLLIDIIGGEKRHRDYDRVTEYAKNLTRLITGEDMAPLMRRFDQRESVKQFKQREDITMHITKTVSKNLMKPAYKIPRSNGVQRVLMYEDDNENKKLHKLDGILDKFWGDKSMDQYLNKRWIELTYTDPNSFIVYEWGEFDNTKERAKPYPFEVSAHEAIYYQFDNNILQFLVVLNEFEKGAGGIPERVQEDNEGKTVLKRYTMYYPSYAIVFDQLSQEDADELQGISDEYIKGAKYIEIKNKIYRINILKSELDFVPAARVGFEYDIVTRGRTCISPIDEAIPILMKTIKANSELDLTMCLTAFPQKVQYIGECKAANCNKGRLPDNSLCGECSGTGLQKTSTSAQEVIELSMPRDKEDLVSLDNIITYKYPPVDLIKFQDEYIKSLTAQCKEAIYNSEIFSRQQIAETATGKNIDLQNVYDALYPMAMAYSYMWGFSIMTISNITDMDKKLVYSYIFSRDFKMKSLNDLYNDLKMVADSKADPFIKQGIQDDIARIIYTDDPIGYRRYKTKEAFYPYSGKTQEQIAMILSTVPNTNFSRVLWEIYGWIFNEIEIDYTKKNVSFYELARSKQWTVIEKRVNAVIKERKEEPMPEIKEIVD